MQWKPSYVEIPLEAEFAVEHLMRSNKGILLRFSSLFLHRDQRAEQREELSYFEAEKSLLEADSNLPRRIFFDLEVFSFVPSYTVSYLLFFETLDCTNGLFITKNQ
jgi:hypothetical protein